MLYDGPEACDHTTMAAMMHALRMHGGASVGTSGGAATTAGRGSFSGSWTLSLALPQALAARDRFTQGAVLLACSLSCARPTRRTPAAAGVAS